MDESTLIQKRSIFEADAFPFLNEIYASSIQMTKNEQTAEDLSSTTFEKAWSAFDQFEQGTNIRAWLYKIMTNTYINEYRKKQRTPETVSLDEHEDPDDFYIFNRVAQGGPGVGSKQELLDHFTREDINHAIEKLPDEYRLPIILCDLQGFSYEEIGVMIESPIGTIRSRLNRARKLMQKYLFDYSTQAGQN